MKKFIFTSLLSVLTVCSLLLVAGCNKSSQPATQSASADDHGHPHGPDSDHDHQTPGQAHPSGTPHGGTPVQIGDHDFHLELVHDPIEKKMLAYVLDSHMEKYVNVPVTTFELVARTAGKEYRLTFNSETNSPNATNNSTSVFSASVPDSASVTNFEGVIPEIDLAGKTFENVTFNYPKGSRHAH